PLLFSEYSLAHVVLAMKALAHRGFLALLLIGSTAAAKMQIDHPFVKAAYRGNVSTLQYFLEKGTDVNLVDKDADMTALTAAVESGRTNAVEFLLSKGADPNRAGKSGRTPIIFAAWARQTRTAELLFAKGADVNAADTAGYTALWFA